MISHSRKPVHISSSDEGAGCSAVEQRDVEALREQIREADGGGTFEFTPILHCQSAHHHHPAAWREVGGGRREEGGQVGGRKEGRRGEEGMGWEEREEEGSYLQLFIVIAKF